MDKPYQIRVFNCYRWRRDCNHPNCHNDCFFDPVTVVNARVVDDGRIVEEAVERLKKM